LATYFRDLNLEWLAHYFYVEPHDRDLLESCEEMIIDKGGFIFFYKIEERILGTFALIQLSPEVFELGKMAVSSDSRGMGIGQKMMAFCIAFSKKQKWSKLLLYSSTKLDNSIYIYKKFGFVVVPIEKDNPYARSNIKMQLNLK
jgi:predicted GNAT family N-acyltransferase